MIIFLYSVLVFVWIISEVVNSVNLLVLHSLVGRRLPPKEPSGNFRFEVIQPPPGYEEWISPVVLPSPVQDGSQGWVEALGRAKQFVSQLTIEEKVNLTTGSGVEGRCLGQTGTIPRLGFHTAICLHDSPSGVRSTDGASFFPASINTAATFDKNLMHLRGVALGAEFAGKGINVALGPMTNLMRAPAAGRNWEGFGSDPFLSGVASVQSILGMQSTGVSACVKHYIGNEQEHYRGGSGATSSSSNIDDRTLREIYGWPFEESIRAGVDYIMCSYNRINQTQMCENSKLINGLVKGEQHFQGVFVSDWGAAISGVRAALGGLDMNMPGFTGYGQPSEPNPAQANISYWGLHLVEAVRNGSVPMDRLDDMAMRIMSTYYKQGQDRDSYPRLNFRTFGQGSKAEQETDNKHVIVHADHNKLIREIGAASTVLLKNVKRILPLRSPDQLKSIAIIGSDAGSNPAGPNSCKDRGCNNGTLAGGWGSGTAEFPYLITPAEAIEAYTRTQNPSIILNMVLNDTTPEDVMTAASISEISIVHVSADSGEAYITVEDNVGDRNNLSLWHGGDQLILAAAAVCRDTVVVIHSVGPVDMEAWIEHPNVTAVLYAGLPGQESGNAEVDILWGAVNPSARLPFTIGKSREDYPADVLYNSSATIPQITYTEGLMIDYRHFDRNQIEPRYPYGFGLSYTSFKYSDLSFQKHEKSNTTPSRYDIALSVTFMIHNVGSVDGHEVPQLYLGFPDDTDEPVRVLRGFERVMVKAGGTGSVKLTLRVIDISIWYVVKQDWVVPSNQMNVWIGSSSRDLHLNFAFVY